MLNNRHLESRMISRRFAYPYLSGIRVPRGPSEDKILFLQQNA
jgi:hypothetical protein